MSVPLLCDKVIILPFLVRSSPLNLGCQSGSIMSPSMLYVSTTLCHPEPVRGTLNSPWNMAVLSASSRINVRSLVMDLERLVRYEQHGDIAIGRGPVFHHRPLGKPDETAWTK